MRLVSYKKIRLQEDKLLDVIFASHQSKGNDKNLLFFNHLFDKFIIKFLRSSLQPTNLMIELLNL